MPYFAFLIRQSNLSSRAAIKPNGVGDIWVSCKNSSISVASFWRLDWPLAVKSFGRMVVIPLGLM